MSELAASLDRALLATTFRTAGGTGYSAEEFHDELSPPLKRVPETWEVLSASPVVSDNWVGAVADHLRDRLSGYMDVDTDRIGHSFDVTSATNRHLKTAPDSAVEIQSSSSLAGFARGLIRAAAVLGADGAARLIGLWAGGEPLHCRILVVLAGVHVDEDIELNQDLRVYRLSISSDSLPISLPKMMRGDSVSRILGHTVLEFKASTSPALFVPPQSDDVYTPIPLLTRTALGRVSLNTFFLALSLICNRQVGLAWSWIDYGEAGSFADPEADSSMLGPGMATELLAKGYTRSLTTGVTQLSSYEPPTPNLCENGLRRAWDLQKELQRRIDSDQRFQTAVTRWAKAASPGVLDPDRVIDLRIALESLYISSSEGELGFRLSITGARHLGTSLVERKAIRKTLVDFYRLASRVIHGTPLSSNTDVSLVDAATKLCRDGILKIVEGRNQPDWTDFLLS